MLGRHVLCGAAMLGVVNLAQAQGTVPIPQASGLGLPSSAAQPLPMVPASSSTEDKARIERLERQVQELTNMLKSQPSLQAPISAAPQGGLTANDVRSLIDTYFTEQKKGDEMKAKVKDDEGYKVGTDLNKRMNVLGTWGQTGLTFETPNKDFTARVGVRVQYDTVWFHQGANNAAQIGKLLDGEYWRRIRPYWSGTFWEIGEYNVELKLEIIQNGTVGMDDVWFGVKDIPFIGSIRAGAMHVPHGLEADMYSSSKPSTFFEVYSGNAAFFQGERVAAGVMATNSFVDRNTKGEGRMTYAAFFGRPGLNDNATDFANGDYEGIFRLTGLPIWDADGRCFLHIGGSATFRHTRNNVTTGAPGTATFSTDGELRDRTGGDNRFGSNTNPVLNGFQPSPGNANAWLSTGAILCASTSVFGAEFLYNNGPFSIQAEYDWAFMNDARVGGKQVGNIGFTGGYIQAGYFLTGESRQYDRRLGRLNSEYIAKPNQPFWLVHGDDGRINWGLGAWEVATRFSRLDLLDPTVRAGILDQWETGINWHLNNNMRVQFMYLHGTRYDLPAKAPGSWTNGFGIRTQFFF
jgi:phosphate-selective porin OprO/OprP